MREYNSDSILIESYNAQDQSIINQLELISKSEEILLKPVEI